VVSSVLADLPQAVRGPAPEPAQPPTKGRRVSHSRVHRHVLLLVACTALVVLVAPPPVHAQAHEPVDLDALYVIKREGLDRSQIMDVMSWLTDVHGPRLTGSPNLQGAADYAGGQLRDWGLRNITQEVWGEFGQGWTNDRFYAHALEPQAYPLVGYAKAWTPGTDGTVLGEAVRVTIETDADFDRYRGQLAGKFVLTAVVPDAPPLFDAPARRYTDDELARLTTQPTRTRRRTGRRRRGDREFPQRRMAFFLEEGVAALLEPGPNPATRGGETGAVWVQSGGSRNPDAPPVAPQIVLLTEHYGRIARTLDKDLPVTLELQVRNTFHTETLDAFNLIAEIQGTDKADEVVMLGAHFDSWHTGTGATDNAAGSAVMMEAMRILKAIGLPMRRTVRVALWTGEESGLLGSRAYVATHFGDARTMELTLDHDRLSGYFNMDNGTGLIRGVYLQGNEAIAPVFEAWMEPLASLGMTTLSIRNTGGTDHLAFDALGLPGFQFIQDPVDYRTRTHHTNLDLYERAQPTDLMHNAVIVASFVYHAANREALLPRKPLPQPATEGGRRE
jgi:carboxypeptidase Q